MPRESTNRGRLAPTIFLVCAALAGCSKNNTPSGPTMPPAPPNPYAISCPGVGGVPVDPSGAPFAGRLTNIYSGGMASDSISLSLFYTTNSSSGYNLRNVVGSATLNTKTLLGSGGMGMPGSQGAYGFCVTSISTTPNGGATPGDLDQSYMPWSVSMTLQGNTPALPGMMGAPSYPGGYGNPGYGGPGYGGYPGYGGGYSQPYAEVSIGGQQCPAFVYQGRLLCSPQQGYGQSCPCIQVYLEANGMQFGAYYISQ